MRQEIASLWVERLRNGNIAQGKSSLGTVHDARCCLGVLCDIAVANNVIAAPEVYGATPYLCYAGEVLTLPKSVQEWAEMQTDTGELGRRLPGESLATLNDKGYSFPELAILIEQNTEIL